MKENLLSFLAYIKMLSILSISIGMLMILALFFDKSLKISPDYKRLIMFFAIPSIVLLLSVIGIKKLKHSEGKSFQKHAA